MNFADDVMDFKSKLTDAERNLIGNVLKGFTQTELIVGNDYWANKVSTWFPKPEIQLMAMAFSGMEAVHTVSYSQIDENLNLDDYEGFLQDPATVAKLSRLSSKEKTIKDKARSLAIFSAFTEGVSLFSSFAILLNFKRFNKLPAIGKIITYSIRDESLHSAAGCWLFRTLAKQQNLYEDKEFKKSIYEAARLTIKLEEDFIDKAFELGDVDGLKKEDLKNFIKHRANSKLKELGLKMNWKNIDKESVERIDSWFSIQSGGSTLSDFFHKRPTDYSKGSKNFDNCVIRKVL